METAGGNDRRTALIAYVTLNRVVPWKILSLPENDDANFFPVGYGSNQKALKSAGKGTTLWVLTLPSVTLRPEGPLEVNRAGRKMACPDFSLVARLNIDGVYKCLAEVPFDLRSEGVARLLKDWGWVAVAAPAGSRFFGFNRVCPKVLENHRVIASDDLSEPALIRQRLGARLQTIRVIRENVSELEKDLNNDPDPHTSGRPELFISFKSEDSFEDALKLAEAMTENGWTCWFDSFAIPLFRRAPKDEDIRGVERHKGRLQRLIEWGIKKSQLGVAFVTPGYAAGGPSWTEFELGALAEEKKARPTFLTYAIVERLDEPDARVNGFDGKGLRLPAPELAKQITQWSRGRVTAR